MLTTSSLNIQFIEDLNFNLSNFASKKRGYEEDDSDENQMTDLETNENDSDTNEKLKTIITMKKRFDPRGPYQVQKNVRLLLDRWGKVIAIPPWQFLIKLMKSRGYKYSPVSCIERKM